MISMPKQSLRPVLPRAVPLALALLCTPLAQAQQPPRPTAIDPITALTAPRQEIRFTAYGETELAPKKVFADKKRTYVQLAADFGQRIEAFEVTAIGYRRMPSKLESPFLVVEGQAASMALAYPGRPLVFLEFSGDSIAAPASAAELAIRMRERANQLLEAQTRVRQQEDESEREQQRKAAALEQERKAIEVRNRQLQEQRQQAEAQQAALEQQRKEIAALGKPVKLFEVLKADGSLRGVLTRWAANEGLTLEWSASESLDAAIAENGAVDAKSFREAMTKVLDAFRSDGKNLVAVIYSNNVVEIKQE